MKSNRGNKNYIIMRGGLGDYHERFRIFFYLLDIKLALPADLSVQFFKPSHEQSSGSNEFPNHNLRQIGQGIHELLSDIQDTD